MFVILSSSQVTLIIHSFIELRKGFKRYQIYMSIIWVGLFTFFKTAKWFKKKSVNCSITVYISYSLKFIFFCINYRKKKKLFDL